MYVRHNSTYSSTVCAMMSQRLISERYHWSYYIQIHTAVPSVSSDESYATPDQNPSIHLCVLHVTHLKFFIWIISDHSPRMQMVMSISLLLSMLSPDGWNCSPLSRRQLQKELTWYSIMSVDWISRGHSYCPRTDLPQWIGPWTRLPRRIQARRTVS